MTEIGRFEIRQTGEVLRVSRGQAPPAVNLNHQRQVHPSGKCLILKGIGDAVDLLKGDVQRLPLRKVAAPNTDQGLVNVEKD